LVISLVPEISLVLEVVDDLLLLGSMVDQIPEDRTIREAADADYRYIGIDTTCLDIARTVQRIERAIPEVYAG
jgi:hypothetical protein